MSLAYQVHHIIPTAEFNDFDTLFEEIEKAGYSIPELQAYDNRIMLFTDPAHALAVSEQLKNNPTAFGQLQIGGLKHTGGHENYSKQIDLRLGKILAADVSPEIKSYMVWDLHQTATEMMMSSDNSLYIDSANGQTSQQHQDQLKAYFDQHLFKPSELDPSNPANKANIEHVVQTSKLYNHDIFDADGKNNDGFVKQTFAQFIDSVDVDSGHYSPSTVTAINKAVVDLDARTQTIIDQHHAQGISIDHETARAQAVHSTLVGDIRNIMGRAVYDKAHTTGVINGFQDAIDMMHNPNITPELFNTYAHHILTYQNMAKGSVAFTNYQTHNPFNQASGIVKVDASGRRYYDPALLQQTIIDNPNLSMSQKTAFMSKLGDVANKAGYAGIALSIMALATNVNAANTPEEKAAITNDWATQMSAEWIAGMIGSGLAVGGSIALGVTSAPIIFGVSLVGGIVGSIVGGDDVREYINEAAQSFFGNITSWIFDQTAYDDVSGMAIYDDANALFQEALGLLIRRDPLTLDLDGDGIETVGIDADSLIQFDHNGDGVKTATGWVLPDDGMLVYDINGNGVIDNGTELFGDSTLLEDGTRADNGFAALVAQDTNQDGVVDAQDANFEHLRVWRDLNLDGISQASELFTLSELNIARLEVAHTVDSDILNNGNEIAEFGKYIKTDGSEVMLSDNRMADVNLVSNNFYRTFTDSIEIDDTVRSLPNVLGSGNLRDLHEATMLSPPLKNALMAFARLADADFATYQDAIEQIILLWTQTHEDYQSLSERASDTYTVEWQYIDDEPATPELIAEWSAKLMVIETFNGQSYFQLPQTGETPMRGLEVSVDEHDNAILLVDLKSDQMEAIDAVYHTIVGGIHNSLLIQTKFQPLIERIGLVENSSGDLELGFYSMHDYLAEDPSSFAEKITMLSYFVGMNNEAFGDGNWIGEAVLTTIEASDVLQDWMHQANVTGILNSDDVQTLQLPRFNVLQKESSRFDVSDLSNDQWIYGNDKSNYIQTGDGDDVIFSGSGDDIIDAGLGHNRFIFNVGDGQDQLFVEAESTASLVIHADSSKYQILNESVADAYQITHTNGGDTITLYPEFLSNPNNTITFNDTVMTLADFKQKFISDNSTSGDDTIFGFADDDTINGHMGNDYIFGGLGDDTLIGGKGDDMLMGGEGKDCYIYHLGDGQDRIELNSSDTLIDELHLDVNASDVGIYAHGDDLIIRFHDSETDSILLIDALVQQNDLTLQFADESRVALSEMAIDPFSGSKWDDMLFGSEQADTLIGGEGNDILYGYAGDDTLIGGQGDDCLDGGIGVNTYVYAIGDGQDYITLGSQSAGNRSDHIVIDTDSDNVSVSQLAGLSIQVGDNADDTITLFTAYDEDNTLKSIRFADGVSWTYDDLIRKASQSNDGDDIVYGDETDDVIDCGAGDDTIYPCGGNNIIYFCAGDGKDVLMLDSSENTQNHIKLDFDSTDVVLTLDKFNLFSISYKIIGSDDSLVMDNPFVEGSTLTSIEFADGSIWDLQQIQEQTLNIDYAQPNEIVGSFTNDILSGTLAKDNIIGLAGDDTLHGSRNDDMLVGGTGVNHYTFDVGDGHDVIKLTLDNADLNTEDHLIFNCASNEVSLSYEYGQLFIHHINGEDSVIIDDAFDDDTTLASICFTDITWSLEDIISNTTIIKEEYEYDNEYDDEGDDYHIMEGTDKNDELLGTEFDDYLMGLAGSDILRGGNGDDILNGGLGEDRLIGGTGDDIYHLLYDNDIITENINEGEDCVVSSLDEYYLDDNIESLILHESALNGFGNNLDNSIMGNDNANVLAGGKGADILVGGKGSDIYQYHSIEDSLANFSDVIYDFVSGEDKIDLSRVDSNTSVAGHQSFDFIGNENFTEAGQMRFENGFLYANVNNNLSADFVIDLSLSYELQLNMGDFVL